jgi:hypothetical protein
MYSNGILSRIPSACASCTNEETNSYFPSGLAGIEITDGFGTSIVFCWATATNANATVTPSAIETRFDFRCRIGDLPVANNAAVQPAAGEEVSNSETPDPPLGCNGLFVVFGCHKGRFEAACRRAASCAIANTSPSNRSEISNRISWISSIVLSAFVGFIA